MKKPILAGLLLCFLSLFFLFPNGGGKWETQIKKFATIYELIKTHYTGDMDEKSVVFASINGLLKSLDPHSYFLDPLTLRSMFEDQKGNYFGIGIRIIKYGNRLTVLAPLKDTPASRLGILAGDVIVEIEGKKTEEMPIEEAMKMLRGEKNTFVHIKIHRAGIADTIPFRIKRAEIPLTTISYSLPHPDLPLLGYISIRTFGTTTPEELRDQLNILLDREGIKGLILDLRGNTGGSLYAAVRIADYFLEKGTPIVSIKGRNEEKKYFAQKSNEFERLPLTVLINRQSASASEIVASALQDHGRAAIIGTRSWGKGLVETVHRVSLDCAVALTTAKYFTPSDKSLQRDYTTYDTYMSVLHDDSYDHNGDIEGGVIPDILVKSDVYPPFIVGLISKGIFFRFSRELMDNGVKIEEDFTATPEIIQSFRRFLSSRKIEFSQEQFDHHRDIIVYEIERDVLSNRFSADIGIRVFLRADPVTAKAAEILTNLEKKGA